MDTMCFTHRCRPTESYYQNGVGAGRGDGRRCRADVYKGVAATSSILSRTTTTLMRIAPLRSECAFEVKVLGFEMAYPFQQSPYMDYSNPASPWSVDQQLQQPQTPIQAGTPSNQSNLTISPPVYQQQLSPIDSPVPFAQNQNLQAYETPRTIQIEEQAAPRPSQLRFESLNPSHFEQHHESAGAETRAHRRTSSSKAPTPSRDEVSKSTSPGSGGAGPSRVPHVRAHTHAHPYRRPQSSEATSPAGTTTTTGVMMQTQMSRTGQAAAGRRSASAAPSSAVTRTERGDSSVLAERTATRPSRGVPLPSHALNKTAVSCPAYSVWRVSTSTSTYSDSGEQQAQQGRESELGAATTRYAAPSLLSAVLGESSCFQYFLFSPFRSVAPAPDTDTAAASVVPVAPAQPQQRRLLISTDLWVDSSSNEIVAVLELPGVKKETLHIKLHTCPYSGCRQLLVQGHSQSSIPDGAHAVHERRTGICSRAIFVPLATQVSTRSMCLVCRSVTSTAARRRVCQDGGRTAHH